MVSTEEVTKRKDGKIQLGSQLLWHEDFILGGSMSNVGFFYKRKAFQRVS